MEIAFKSKDSFVLRCFGGNIKSILIRFFLFHIKFKLFLLTVKFLKFCLNFTMRKKKDNNVFNIFLYQSF